MTGDVDVNQRHLQRGQRQVLLGRGRRVHADHQRLPRLRSAGDRRDRRPGRRPARLVTSPYWDSGKPGATVKMALDNFPAGWINRVTGYTDDPKGTAYKDLRLRGPPRASRQSLERQDPVHRQAGLRRTGSASSTWTAPTTASAVPREMYQVVHDEGVQDGDPQGHEDPPHRHRAHRGPLGRRHGPPKVVTVYAHKGRRRVPTKWNPGKRGLVQARHECAPTGYGAYTTPYFKPPSTLTLVVRYPGDDWYYDALHLDPEDHRQVTQV